MTSELIDKEKEIARNWFRELRDRFCKKFEEIDGEKFSRKSWKHSGEGGGEMSTLKGNVFEKVGVNISTVKGAFKEDFRNQISGTENAPDYWASGISVVAHMKSPHVPAFHFNTRLWMVLPLSENPCAPAQGAVAIEVNDKRNDIIDIVKSINHSDTFESVKIERDTLEKYGGGCHQKIGVSNEKTIFGDIFTIKGITEDNVVLSTRKLNRKSKNEDLWKSISLENIFPLNLEKYNIFTRQEIRKNIEKASKLKNYNILATRGNVLDGISQLDSKE